MQDPEGADEMCEQWVSDVTRHALTWGAWAVVVVTVLGSGSPADAAAPAQPAAALSSR
jgi:hypothetical protein